MPGIDRRPAGSSTSGGGLSTDYEQVLGKVDLADTHFTGYYKVLFDPSKTTPGEDGSGWIGVNWEQGTHTNMEWDFTRGDGVESGAVNIFVNGGGANVVLYGPNNDGLIDIYSGDASIIIKGRMSQVVPAFDVQDSDGNSCFSIAPDGTVGGTTPSDGDQLTWDAASGSIKWKGPLV